MQKFRVVAYGELVRGSDTDFVAFKNANGDPVISLPNMKRIVALEDLLEIAKEENERGHRDPCEGFYEKNKCICGHDRIAEAIKKVENVDEKDQRHRDGYLEAIREVKLEVKRLFNEADNCTQTALDKYDKATYSISRNLYSGLIDYLDKREK